MALFDVACPTEVNKNPLLPLLKSTPGNSRTLLFYETRIVQNRLHWVLVDSCFDKNLIYDKVFKQARFNHRFVQ